MNMNISEISVLSDGKYIEELFFIINFLIAVDFLLLNTTDPVLGFFSMLSHDKREKGRNYLPGNILLHAGHSNPASTLHRSQSGL